MNEVIPSIEIADQNMANDAGVSHELKVLLGKTVLAGLRYHDLQGALLQQRQIYGEVVRVTPNDGITLRFVDGKTEFTLPSTLSPWFIAPKGDYVNADLQVKISNPDYLVTWDIYKTQDITKPKGEHEWWEWQPNTIPPVVGRSS